MTLGTEHIEALRADARYHRERLALYRAKAYGPRPTTPARLAELERTYALAASSLRRAAANQAAKDPASAEARERLGVGGRGGARHG